MRKVKGSLIVLASGIVFAASSYALASNKSGAGFSPEQQKDIQKIMHDYLVSNPEVLIEASQALQNKEMEKTKKQAMQGINSSKSKLFNNPNSPSVGNATPDAIVVEFFDYQCSHCKEMQPTIAKVLDKKKNVKVIFKEFPIFGATSNYAAQMALAAAKQGKYLEFHDALLKSNDSLSESKIQEIAKSVGLDVEKLKTDMNDPSVKQEIKDNYELAKALGLNGTPSFVFSNKNMTQFDFIPGAAPEDSFQKAVDDIAKK